jgi:hypothetical protein
MRPAPLIASGVDLRAVAEVQADRLENDERVAGSEDVGAARTPVYFVMTGAAA